MRDRVRKYDCTECGIVASVDIEYIDDGYGGEEKVVRCAVCGRIIE